MPIPDLDIKGVRLAKLEYFQDKYVKIKILKAEANKNASFASLIPLISRSGIGIQIQRKRNLFSALEFH